MVLAGVVHVFQAFKMNRWNMVIVQLLAAVLYGVAGFVIIQKPASAALALTLMIATFFMIGGIFKIISAFALQIAAWGWILLSGIISLALGVMVLNQWPASGLWLIGFYIGVDLIAHGTYLFAYSLALHNARRHIGPISTSPTPA